MLLAFPVLKLGQILFCGAYIQDFQKTRREDSDKIQNFI